MIPETPLETLLVVLAVVLCCIALGFAVVRIDDHIVARRRRAPHAERPTAGTVSFEFAPRALPMTRSQIARLSPVSSLWWTPEGRVELTTTLPGGPADLYALLGHVVVGSRYRVSLIGPGGGLFVDGFLEELPDPTVADCSLEFGPDLGPEYRCTRSGLHAVHVDQYGNRWTR